MTTRKFRLSDETIIILFLGAIFLALPFMFELIDNALTAWMHSYFTECRNAGADIVILNQTSTTLKVITAVRSITCYVFLITYTSIAGIFVFLQIKSTKSGKKRRN